MRTPPDVGTLFGFQPDQIIAMSCIMKWPSALLALSLLLCAIAALYWHSARPEQQPSRAPASPSQGIRITSANGAPSPPSPIPRQTAGTHQSTRPQRPAFSRLTAEEAAQFAEYARHLWALTAVETKEEVDKVLNEKSGIAALRLIRDRALRPGATGPIIIHQSHYVIPQNLLQEYDFEAWFRRLQYTRLIPYVAAHCGDVATTRAATQLLGELMLQSQDGTMSFCAVCSLDDDPIFSTPGIRPSIPLEGGEFFGMHMFVGSDTRSRFSDDKAFLAALDAYEVPMFPLIRDDPEATRILVRVLEGVRKRPEAIDLRLLKHLPEMAGVEEHVGVFVQIITDPEEFSGNRHMALQLVEDSGSHPGVRRAFERAIAQRSEHQLTAERFIEALPRVYPQDEAFVREVAGILHNVGEPFDVRESSARALLEYYGNTFHTSEYREALARFMLEAAERGGSNALDDMNQRIVELNLTEFVPVYEQILTRFADNLDSASDLREGLESLKAAK